MDRLRLTAERTICDGCGHLILVDEPRHAAGPAEINCGDCRAVELQIPLWDELPLGWRATP